MRSALRAQWLCYRLTCLGSINARMSTELCLPRSIRPKQAAEAEASWLLHANAWNTPGIRAPPTSINHIWPVDLMECVSWKKWRRYVSGVTKSSSVNTKKLTTLACWHHTKLVEPYKKKEWQQHTSHRPVLFREMLEDCYFYCCRHVTLGCYRRLSGLAAYTKPLLLRWPLTFEELHGATWPLQRCGRWKAMFFRNASSTQTTDNLAKVPTEAVEDWKLVSPNVATSVMI